MASTARLRRFDDVARFRDAVEPYLLEREAEHCLLLGLLSGLTAGEWSAPYLASVEDDERTVLVALRTPPHRLVTSQAAEGADVDAAVALLAADAADATDAADAADATNAAEAADAAEAAGASGADDDLPGVVGDVRVAQRFAELWSERHGRGWRVAMAERIYRCERVEPVPVVPGHMRAVVPDDHELLRPWLRAFLEEALPSETPDPEAQVTRVLASPTRSLWAWETDGAVVAIAGATGPTPNGIRIGPVYTSPERRRRGFATALVAELTRTLLGEGRRFCFLFTDLANPTSNAIYQRIGYLPVADVAAIDFVRARA